MTFYISRFERMKLIKGFIRSSTHLFLVIALLQLSCCDKSKNITECQGYLEYPPMLKDICLFKDSSYWIYKEKNSGLIDSISTIGVWRDEHWPKKETGTKDCPCYEIFASGYKSSYYNLQYDFQMDAIYDGNPINRDRLSFQVIYRQNATSKSEYRFNTLGYDSLLQGVGALEAKYTKFKDVTVLGTKYNNPIYFYYSNPTPYDWIQSAYYVPHVGIVKYEHEDGKVWELVRYEIKQ